MVGETTSTMLRMKTMGGCSKCRSPARARRRTFRSLAVSISRWLQVHAIWYKHGQPCKAQLLLDITVALVTKD